MPPAVGISLFLIFSQRTGLTSARQQGIQLLNKPKKNQPNEPLKSQAEGVEYIQRAAESGSPEQLRPYLLAAYRLAQQLGHTECEELLRAHL